MAVNNWNSLWTHLKAYIDSKSQTVDGEEYGVEWDITNSTFTRLGDAVGKTGGSDFSMCYPWAGMRRCNLTDDGVVTAYFGNSNFSETGSNGQVMVEIPKFYYKTVPVAYSYTNGDIVPTKVAYYVSKSKKAGYKLHPAFIRNGEELDYVYLGAYEGCVYDVSASAYVDDFAFDAANDILGSIKGKKPVSGKHATFTRAIARSMAQRRGAGWEQQDFLATSAVQMLMLIEYASFDVQTKIGAGVSNKTDDGSTNMAEATGYTSSLGSASGEANTSTATHKAVSYRGIENFWGNIWIWIDGLNIIGYVPYYADHGFADDISNGTYKKINGKVPTASGYIDKLIYDGSSDFAMLPSSSAGASNKPVNDYVWVNSGNRVALLGGSWSNGLYCGGWYWHLHHASSHSHRAIGARLGFYRKTTHAAQAA